MQNIDNLVNTPGRSIFAHITRPLQTHYCQVIDSNITFSVGGWRLCKIQIYMITWWYAAHFIKMHSKVRNETFADTKVVTRRRKSKKNRQRNGEKQ
jgi:hypothetical protein